MLIGSVINKRFFALLGGNPDRDDRLPFLTINRYFQI